MTTLKLIDSSIPQLQLTDTVSVALHFMEDFKASHLPVTDDYRYLGLISEEDLLEKDNDQNFIEAFHSDFLPAQVNENKHFLKAVPVGQLYNTNIIPVTGEGGDFMGSIKQADLMNAVGNLCGANEFGALIVMEVAPSRLSISEINSIVESDGATIVHLNIIPIISTQLMQITLQINKQEVSTIVASFERYEYLVLHYSGEEFFENQLNTNYQNLMNYLHI